MKATAKIVDPFDIEKVIVEEMILNDLPVSENSTIINGVTYIIVHTLFYNWDIDSYYYHFEQKIKKEQQGMRPPQPFLLLIGKIRFDDNEREIILKEIKVKPEYEDGYNTINDKVKVPYSYMRVSDLIEIKNEILVCGKIIVVEDIEIRIDFFRSPMTVKDFREDKNHFLKNMWR